MYSDDFYVQARKISEICKDFVIMKIHSCHQPLFQFFYKIYLLFHNTGNRKS